MEETPEIKKPETKNPETETPETETPETETPEIKSSVKKAGGLKRNLKFVISQEKTERCFTESFLKIQKTAKTAGFRKGKIPLGILRKQFYGKAWKMAGDSLFQAFYPKALTANHLNPAGPPKLLSIDLEEGKPCGFAVELEVHPEIKTVNYSGLKIKKPGAAVTEEDLDQALQDLRKNFSEYKKLEESRPLKPGDGAVIAMEGRANSKKERELCMENVFLKIGENRVAPHFDERLAGLRPGEEKSFDFLFPKSHSHANLAGKNVFFKIKLKFLAEKRLPELNSDFAKKFKLKDISELKERIKKDLHEIKREKIQKSMEKEVSEKLVEANPLEVPESLLKEEKLNIAESAKKRLKGQGASPGHIEEFLKSQDSAFEKEAEFNIRSSYLIKSLIKDLGVKPLEKEIRDSLRKNFSSRDPEEIKKELQKKNYWNHFLFNISVKKALSLLIEKAEAIR